MGIRGILGLGVIILGMVVVTPLIGGHECVDWILRAAPSCEGVVVTDTGEDVGAAGRDGAGPPATAAIAADTTMVTTESGPAAGPDTVTTTDPNEVAPGTALLMDPRLRPDFARAGDKEKPPPGHDRSPAKQEPGPDPTTTTTTEGPTTTTTAAATTTTTTATSTTTTTATPSGVDVVLRPGDSIQAAVNANPPGTVFLISKGTHRRQSVVPKSDDVFLGEPGAVLDGEGVAAYAIHVPSSPVTGVIIRSLEITNYATPAQQGMVGGGGAQGWVIEDNEISYSKGGGVALGSGAILRRNLIHHNDQIGVLGNRASGAVVEGNEISYNNYRGAFDIHWEAGGTKFIRTSGLVLRGNHVHHNTGHGLWLDTDNIDALYVGNIVTDNSGHGIFHEVSYRSVIRNNRAERNGKAGIWIANSPDVDVYGNQVSGNSSFGIAATQDKRGSGAYGPYDVANLYVHDNTITMSQGWTGLQQGVGDTSFFTSRNNRFQANTYQLGSADGKFYAWMGSTRTKSEWLAYGNDVDGTWLP